MCIGACTDAKRAMSEDVTTVALRRVSQRRLIVAVLKTGLPSAMTLWLITRWFVACDYKHRWEYEGARDGTVPSATPTDLSRLQARIRNKHPGHTPQVVQQVTNSYNLEGGLCPLRMDVLCNINLHLAPSAYQLQPTHRS